MCDLRAAQKDIRAGNIANNRTAFLYNQFQEFCATMQIEHWLDDPTLPVAEILQVYGHRVRHGHWSKLSQVRVDSVSVAWRAIATVHLLDGRPNPIKPRDSSSRDLDLRLSRQLRTYSFQDPPPTSCQKPAPLGLVVAAARNVGSGPEDWCLADLGKIGCIFAYARVNTEKPIRTVALHNFVCVTCNFRILGALPPLMPLTLIFFKR